MTIANKLDKHLKEQSVDYQLVPHHHTESSVDSAAAAHIPPERLAKAVIVRDGESYLMVVVPSEYHVHLGHLHRHLGREVGLATEQELVTLFADCDEGAIPPCGALYGLKTLVDTAILAQPEVFFESGDHETLVKVSGEQFRSLLGAVEAVDVAKHL